MTVLMATLVVMVLAGCQVTTAVVVQVRRSGAGTVTVTVRLDRAAVDAVGGVTGQLRTSDLVQAGWKVTTTPGADGSVAVTLSHGFTGLSQVPPILAEVARAPGGVNAPLFTLHLTQTRSFWRATTTAAGVVDLTCGLSCFGDSGLRQAYGSALGVQPGAAGGPGSAATAAPSLRFSFRLEVPGRVVRSSGSGPGRLVWTPVLGRRTPVSLVAREVNRVRVREASAAGGVTVVGIGLVITVALGGVRRRASRRRAGATNSS